MMAGNIGNVVERDRYIQQQGPTFQQCDYMLLYISDMIQTPYFSSVLNESPFLHKLHLYYHQYE